METDSDPQDGRDSDASEFLARLEKSTLPADIRISVHGQFQSEDEAKELWQTALFFFKMFGTSLKLEELEAVTIADNYAGALALVDRGFDTRPLSASNDEFGSGAAMAVPVIRDGTLKTHIVLHSGLVRALVNPEEEMYAEAVHTLAHEAAHAHDHLFQARAFPGLYGTHLSDWRDNRLFSLAHKCWNEYIACRLSAGWGTDAYCKNYSDMLCSMISTARERGNVCIDRFSGLGEILKTEGEIIDVYGTLLVRTSYLVGHVHGLGTTVEEKAPDFLALVMRTPWFKLIYERYEANVNALFEGYGEWKGIEVFEHLKLTFETLLNAGGMFYRRLPTGNYYIDLNRPSA